MPHQKIYIPKLTLTRIQCMLFGHKIMTTNEPVTYCLICGEQINIVMNILRQPTKKEK